MSPGENSGGLQFGFRAQLIGGPISGETVELPSFEPRICVYRNGGAPFALSPEATPPGDVALLGEYDIVEPLGPDTPTYVARGR